MNRTILSQKTIDCESNHSFPFFHTKFDLHFPIILTLQCCFSFEFRIHLKILSSFISFNVISPYKILVFNT